MDNFPGVQRSWFAIVIPWIAFQLLVTAALALHLGKSQPPPWESYLALSGLVAAIGTTLFAFAQLRHFPPSPFAALRDADWGAVGRLYVACLCLYGQFVALTWMKCLMPFATNFWGDAVLFRFERFLFGIDAWRVFPGPNFAMTYAYIYWPVVVTSVFAFNAMRGRNAVCLAFFLTVGGLGVFGQYLLPSAGPIFWSKVLGIHDFAAPIPHAMIEARDYLWWGYQTGAYIPAAGISAFPSVHVGCATWVALATRSPLGWIYWLFVSLAAIAFGWHYFSGVAFGTVATVLIWKLAHRLTESGVPNPNRQPEASRPTSLARA